MPNENVSRALCFAGGVVVASAAFARYLARRDRDQRRLKGKELQILLERAIVSHPSALHAIISNARGFVGGDDTVHQANTTHPLLGTIDGAKQRWKELVYRSCDIGEKGIQLAFATEIGMDVEQLIHSWDDDIDSDQYFIAISKLREIGMDAEPIMRLWMNWLLSTSNADIVREALDRHSTHCQALHVHKRTFGYEMAEDAGKWIESLIVDLLEMESDSIDNIQSAFKRRFPVFDVDACTSAYDKHGNILKDLCDPSEDRFPITLECKLPSASASYSQVSIDVDRLEEHWRCLVMENCSPNALITAIRRVAAAGGHDSRLSNRWKEMILQSRNPSIVYDVLKQELTEEVGVDAEPLRDHWRDLVLKGCSDFTEVDLAISQADTIGVDRHLFEERWYELALLSRSTRNVSEAIFAGHLRGIDLQPLKDRWEELFFQDVQLTIVSIADILNQFSRFAEIGIVDDMAKKRILTRVFACFGRGNTQARDLLEAIPIICKSFVTPTGKVVLTQVSATDNRLQISCQLLSGTIVLQSCLPSDATIATLENHIKQEMDWESARCVDAQANCAISGHHLLRECPDLVVQEFALFDFGLKKLFASLIQGRMPDTSLHANSPRNSLPALLLDCSDLRKKGIDIVRIESLRDWISSAISSVASIAEIEPMRVLVADVPYWASALATQVRALEARTEAKQSLVSKPSIGTWMMPLPLSKGGNQLREFTVTLRKTPSNSRIGLTVDVANSVCLVVDEITGGLLGDWNERYPDFQVRSGDRILAVNGISGDAVELTQVCKNDDVLRMNVVRERIG